MGGKYYKLRLKSILKNYPTIMLITLATIAAMVIACLMLLNSGGEDEEKGNRLAVGVVGDLEETYFDIGIQAFMSMDNDEKMGFYLELTPYETEEEATEALLKREISGFLLVPDGYMYDIYRGVNNPARYITLNEPVGFGSIISDEVVMMVSDIVVESQNGMYSMQQIAKEQKIKKRGEKVDQLMLFYASGILNRKNFYDDKIIGIEDNLTMGGYYVCGILMLLLLLWGIACNRIFASGDPEYYRMLRISGLKAGGQVKSEFLAYFTATLATLLIGAIGAGIALEYSGFGIAELADTGLLKTLGFFVAIIPVIAMVAMMQSAIYEIIPNSIGAILTQFLVTIVLGYASGCLYPIGFFPEIIQDITYVLPIGAGFATIRKIMGGTFPMYELLMVVGYFILFAAIAYRGRKNKVTGDIR